MTRLDFSNYVVEQLRRVGSGQAPEIEDTQKVFDNIPRFFAYLEKAHIYVVADDDDIDDEAVHPLATYMVWWLSNTFFRQRMEDDRLLAERMLILLQATLPTYEPQTTDYF
jgi:hypothetical protein